MTHGKKRSGSPLEGQPTKLVIVGLTRNRVPVPQVAHLREPAEVSEDLDSTPGASIPSEGVLF